MPDITSIHLRCLFNILMFSHHLVFCGNGVSTTTPAITSENNSLN